MYIFKLNKLCFISQLSLLLKGTVVAPPDKFGKSFWFFSMGNLSLLLILAHYTVMVKRNDNYPSPSNTTSIFCWSDNHCFTLYCWIKKCSNTLFGLWRWDIARWESQWRGICWYWWRSVPSEAYTSKLQLLTVYTLFNWASFVCISSITHNVEVS